MILFFDTETNGLPKNYKGKIEDLNNWPRIIQLAWAQFDDDGNLIQQACDLIRPDGWTIPNEKFWIDNGFYTAHSEVFGIAIGTALEKFIARFNESETIVAHNMEFDYPIVFAELIRAGMTVSNEPAKVCTMKSTTDLCCIPGPYGFKWPKLVELHQHLFNAEFDGAHDALNDVLACAKCFFELKKRKFIQLGTQSTIQYSNIKKIHNLDFETYLGLPGFSHSFLKNERNGSTEEFKETDKIIVGKLVDSILTEPEKADMSHPFYPMAKSIAHKITQAFGQFISKFEKQVSFTAELTFEGHVMKTTCRLDYLFPGHSVIDLKVTDSKDIDALIRFMGYENQTWNYANVAQVKKRYIMIYSRPLKETFMKDLGVLPLRNQFWETKVLKFGKPLVAA